jgi:hypothetical protein
MKVGNIIAAAGHNRPVVCSAAADTEFSEVVRKDFLRVGGDFLRLLVLRGFPLSAPLLIPAPITNANCE